MVSPEDKMPSEATGPQGEAKPLHEAAKADDAPAPVAAAETPGSKFEVAVVSAAEEKAAAKPARKPRVPTLLRPLPEDGTSNAKFPKLKEAIAMATQQTFKTPDFPKLVADAQDKAGVVFDKSAEFAGKLGDVVKGNAEAVVSSGKTLGVGLKELGQDSIADGRQALVTLSDDIRELAEVQGPSDLLRLQGKVAARNIDLAFAFATKSGQSLRALADRTFAPLSDRAKANYETLRKIA